MRFWMLVLVTGMLGCAAVPTVVPRVSGLDQSYSTESLAVRTVGLNCRTLCADTVRKNDEDLPACLRRVHYTLFALQRNHYEQQRYRQGYELSFCLAAHEDVIKGAQIPVPSYTCERLERRTGQPVDLKMWETQCATNPDAWWCEHNFEVQPPYYGFVIAHYEGDCPTVPNATPPSE